MKVRLAPNRRRRSVPGDQVSIAPDRQVRECPRCRGTGQPCRTCLSTGEVTILPRKDKRS